MACRSLAVVGAVTNRRLAATWEVEVPTMSLRLRPVPLLLLTWLLAPAASAQPGEGPVPGPRVWNHVRFAGESEVRVRTAWEPGERGPRGATVTLRIAGRPERLELHRGQAVVTDLAVSGDLALVAMSETDPDGALHLVLVEIPARGAPRVRARRRARMGAGRWLPSTAVAAASPGGFTVLWQAQDFRGRARQARTLMAKVSEDGSFARRPTEVPIPWALADLVWNGAGYHLALFYDGARQNQTRLSMVTLTEDGQPEQHPWWESRPGLVDEVQLVRADEGVVAAWRGGPAGAELRSRRVRVGTWGQEPEGFTVLGPIEGDEEFALRVVDGQADVVRREAADLRRVSR